MIQPQELEVWYVLPAIRRELSLVLLKMGLKQVEIANLLSITKASVSQYLKGKRAKEVKFNENTKEEIRKSAERIAKGKSVIEEIQDMCSLIRSNGTLCEIHKKHCNICCDKLKECGVCLK